MEHFEENPELVQTFVGLYENYYKEDKVQIKESIKYSIDEDDKLLLKIIKKNTVGFYKTHDNRVYYTEYIQVNEKPQEKNGKKNDKKIKNWIRYNEIDVNESKNSNSDKSQVITESDNFESSEDSAAFVRLSITQK